MDWFCSLVSVALTGMIQIVNGDPIQSADCLPLAIELITRQFDPLRIILFGSRARGEARPDSDLDLLVVLPEIENKRDVTIDLMRTLSSLPVSKDVVVTTPREIDERGDVIGLILRPALREGVTVYPAPDAH